ncbi:MAG: bifunctional phosphopantothenoylcysteine decarboxylase/phosphopantothenate--cysteine ligase CoaBC [bacterium]
MNLNKQRILLGITGGIAAYKAAELTRTLKKAGAEVICVMTPAAHEFITPITLQALSGEPVRTEQFDPEGEAAMSHIELARWADLVLVAPASADFMARLASGSTGDLLTTVCLATPARIAIAPAMNQQMWANSQTKRNVEALHRNKIMIIGPDRGEQACGDHGPGRMVEPDDIAHWVNEHFHQGPLEGKRVLVTAGPTREAIDPVRFLSNRSSGKMGFAVAEAARKAGASVLLIAGPVSLPTPAGVTRIDIESAEEMHQQVLAHIDSQDIFIATAAVADYRPRHATEHKLKKHSSDLSLELERTPDILKSISTSSDKPFTVGFAAETEHLEQHAREKLVNKNLDMIAANSVGNGLGFDRDDNALHVFWGGGEKKLARQPKNLLAEELVELIAHRFERL